MCQRQNRFSIYNLDKVTKTGCSVGKPFELINYFQRSDLDSVTSGLVHQHPWPRTKRIGRGFELVSKVPASPWDTSGHVRKFFKKYQKDNNANDVKIEKQNNSRGISEGNAVFGARTCSSHTFLVLLSFK
jgi:hypothetical protein